MPSIAVLHLPSAIGNGLISIAVGNVVAVACIGENDRNLFWGFFATVCP